MVSGEGNIVHSKEAYRMNHMFVPVVDREQRPLMPTTPARARRWIKTARATAFWKGDLFCVRLNIGPSAREHQRIAVGIDPGSKKEALVVASAAHTYLNIQANARTGVKETKKQCADAPHASRTQHPSSQATPEPQAQQEEDTSFHQSPLAVETQVGELAQSAFSL
jgi:hypothetical protein